MSVERCIERLVGEKKISRETADRALGLFRGEQTRFGRTLGAASSDAAAALDVAKKLEQSAHDKKLMVAKQAIAFAKNKDRIAAHPKGKVAGLMGLMTRDIWQHGGENVESQAEAIEGGLMHLFEAGIEGFRSTWFGLKPADGALADRVVDEMFHVETGNAQAGAIAKGFRDATDHGVALAKAGGKIFAPGEDWRLPQSWESYRVIKHGKTAFAGDVRQALATGGLKLWDRDTGDFASGIRNEELISRAYKDIANDVTQGPRDFNGAARTFRFQDGKAGADAYKLLMKKYGPGDNLAEPMVSHIKGMARQTALANIFGPQPRAGFLALHKIASEEAKEEPTKLNTTEKIALFGNTTPAAALRTYDVVSGRANAVEHPAIAGVFGALRNILRTAQLSSAVLTSGPADTNLTMLTAIHNGLPAARVISRAAWMIAHEKDARQLASRLHLVAHGAIDSISAYRRYNDEPVSIGTASRVTAKAASAVIRAQGLQAETEALRTSLSMDFLAQAAESAGKKFGDLDPAYRNFLQRYGLASDDWDKIRATPQLDANGARFILPSAMEDQAVSRRFLGAILDERQFAVMMPSARSTQLNSAWGKKGTWGGEMLRSPLMYKTFLVQMVLTHGMRGALADGIPNKARMLATLAATSTLAGAITVEAKAIMNGQDPRSMASYSFWQDAAITGGTFSYLGDVIKEGASQTGLDITEAMGGPVGEFAGEIGKGVNAAKESIAKGDGRSFGKWLANEARYNLPSGTWYTKLAANRLLWDQFQSMVDPEYRQSFNRQERRAQKQLGTRYWWAPGDTAPARGPDLGNAVTPPAQ